MDDLPGSGLEDILKSVVERKVPLAKDARRRCGTGMSAFGNV